ncbi:MAG: Mur ligase family protein [Candidatus Saccharimonas sp.]
MSETTAPNPAKAIVTKTFRSLAQQYVRLHKPTVITTGGSIGKTSTKLMLAKVLETQKKVSYMDDSYNTGLGLYLSVFQLKVPRNSSIVGWVGKLIQACWRLLFTHPEILIIEYGIDGVGDMDEMLSFIRPDISVLTAVTPEHMEFLKTIDTVGLEEVKILQGAKQLAVVNAVDVDAKYLADVQTTLVRYGREGDEAMYHVKEWASTGPAVEFIIDGKRVEVVDMHVISDALIRQLSGVLLVASRLGIDVTTLGPALARLRPAAGRMNVLHGIHESNLIDDTANFSPVAGVAALTTLKRMPALRHIAVIGNMHELGDFAKEGYEQVAQEFTGLDTLILVGDLSTQWFKPLALQQGFIEGTNLFVQPDSLTAGKWLRDEYVQSGDIILAKGPFGGWYLEETVRLLLRDPQDAQYLTRQSEFWYAKKAAHFGPAYTDSISQA